MSDFLNKEECLEADELCFFFFFSLISELITPSSRISSCGWEYVVVSVMVCVLSYFHVAWLWRFAGPEQFREWSWGICKDLVQGFRCWRSWSWSKIIALSFLILPSVIKQSSVSNVWYKVMSGFFSSFFPFSWSLLLHLQSENNFTRWMICLDH